ncbi:U-box domain-containing protein 11-like isoform X2 [Rutidosis leptorrhynchoides]|uniref:U-box domain-containing protein 11-like isoform X2 n=1 Tax=Rutidosis leptorrhynchoides TaxID=125765 RepID=UPI003A98F41E
MADDDTTAVIAGIQSLLRLVRDIARTSVTGSFKRDCTNLSRRVALLSHLLEEIRDFEGEFRSSASSSSSNCSLSELMAALKAAKSLILSAGSFNHNISPVDLVRDQLKRASERYGGSQDMISLSYGLSSESLAKDSDSSQTLNIDHHHVESKAGDTQSDTLSDDQDENVDQSTNALSEESSLSKPTNAVNSPEDNKKGCSPVIPDDFLCPISLELIRDPVIVSTGQTYDRLYIQRWINGGNKTCPKTRQKLQNLTLTPNYVLRSLITQWCTNHNVDHPSLLLTNRRLKRSDGSFLDVSQDIDLIEAIVHNLTSQSTEERRAAASEVRSLSKRSTDNRILIAEAGAIPVLVDLLTSEDSTTQQHAVTSILNLSIYENNRELIMLANAVPSIVQVLKTGSMQTRENAAATLFSLSLSDENKIIIGASGAIPLLVDLLENGSRRGKNDAATALFNLCIYQGNKGKAVRAGIISALLRMLTDLSGVMVDEALTILSILASHQEAKAAMVRACVIPNIVDHMVNGNSRNKENATSILLSLCKRDDDNLGFISRLGALPPLMELAKNGTERAKRKANSLLGYLQRFQQQIVHDVLTE